VAHAAPVDPQVQAPPAVHVSAVMPQLLQLPPPVPH
jgi:hypothetical protein